MRYRDAVKHSCVGKIFLSTDVIITMDECPYEEAEQ